MTDDDPNTDVTPADDHLGDPAHVSDSLESDAAAVAEQVDAHPDAGHHLADEPADFTPEQVDALVAERDEFLDAYRRTAADFDNYRKRVARDAEGQAARAAQSLVAELLPAE